MSVELVTGYANSKHVSSSDMGVYNVGTVGHGFYQLANQQGEYADPIIMNANTIQIPETNYVFYGRHVRVATAETVNISNGQSGYKRIDLVCAHYKTDSFGVESVVFDVVQGTPVLYGSPTIPEVITKSWNEVSTTDNRVPIARVTFNGLTPTISLDPHIIRILSIEALQTAAGNLSSQLSSTTDKVASLSQDLKIHSLSWKPPHTSDNIRLERVGSMVFVNGNVKFNNNSNYTYSRSFSEKIPSGYRPTGNNTPIACGNCNFQLLIDKSGELVGAGNPNNAYTSMYGAWVTNDAMPRG